MKGAVERHPLVAYFGLTFVLSWAGALSLLLPKLATVSPFQPCMACLLSR